MLLLADKLTSNYRPHLHSKPLLSTPLLFSRTVLAGIATKLRIAATIASRPICCSNSSNMRSAVYSRPTQRSHSRSPSKVLTSKKQQPPKASSATTAAPPHHTLRPQSPQPAITTTHSARSLSPASRAQLLHALHLQHNGALLMAVEKEEQREERREALLAATRDEGERWRLEGSFGLERGEAYERLSELSASLELQLALRMEELGMIRGGWDSNTTAHGGGGEWEEKKQLSSSSTKTKQRKSGIGTQRGRAG